MKFAFIFRSAPHGTSSSREGLDELLAATAFCEPEDLGVYFIDEGVFNLLPNQKPEAILQKDFLKMFKLLDLYDVEARFVCAQSLADFGLQAAKLTPSCQLLTRAEMVSQWRSAQQIFTF